jgi:hypothetical protein
MLDEPRGYRQGMTDHERATSLGQTGGLPGANADPAASELTTDDLAATLPLANAPTATTDVDSHDDGRGAEGDAYDEPDAVEYPDELRSPPE